MACSSLASVEISFSLSIAPFFVTASLRASFLMLFTSAFRLGTKARMFTMSVIAILLFSKSRR